MPILVNFHLHSNFSDGELTPEALAAKLSASGVRFAALTDHDTIEGLPRFQKAAKKRGVSCLPGVELTTWFNGSELHLLGFGFNPDDPDLRATLVSLRQARDLGVHSITGSLRKMGANHPGGAKDSTFTNAAPDGQLETAVAIDLIHRAGGITFLAHPFMVESDPARLDILIGELKTVGLDGLEAFYAPYTEEQQQKLLDLARSHNLPVSVGSDLHTASEIFGVDLQEEHWIQFRQSFFSSPLFSTQSPENEKKTDSNPEFGSTIAKHHHFRRRSYIIRIFLPTLIAIGLFLAVIWGIILPSYEQTLMERKRELIRELTNSAWSILASYERDERNGLLTREQAQSQAITRVEALRYGEEGKDYFWIQDLQPRMVMHPYRSDLNGQDVSDFTDPRGVAIFIEFARQVKLEGEGYLDYVWQWKDDPTRLEPKESYVKGFEPWGWVIGTGIYTDDVRTEISRLERDLVQVSLVISGVIVLLLAFVLQQSLRIERERQEVLDDLHESTERYHSLVEATTEGTLLIIDKRCRFANQTFLGMSGYSEKQLEFLGLSDLFHPSDNTGLWEKIDSIKESGASEATTFEGVLIRADNSPLDCILGISPIQFAGQNGLILLCRDVSVQPSSKGSEALGRAAQDSHVGIFRAIAEKKAAILECNPAAREFFIQPQPSLADLFQDPDEFEEMLRTLLAGGDVRDHVLRLEFNNSAMQFLSLSARRVSEDGRDIIVGTLQDVTSERKEDIDRELVIEKLQSSLMFLHEPLRSLERDTLICDRSTTIPELARLMKERGVTAALVSSDEGIIGMVTDLDLREWMLAGNSPADAAVQKIMSSHVNLISEDAPIYEALMRMEEKDIRHLAVNDRDGQIVSVVDSGSLIQFQRYGAVVLSREILRAPSREEIARLADRTPLLVKTLVNSSARPRHVTRTISSICDSVTERLVRLAIETLGEPPSDFAFIAMGSHGRQEQTLTSDQDNGIIFLPQSKNDHSKEAEYFLQLGKQVSEGLSEAGFPLCRGGVMASQPRWCRPLPEWVSGFEEWVQKAEPQEIIDLSIFFDFRTVYGNSEFSNELRRSIFTILDDKPAFYNHFAQNALTFKPPFRLLGNIYLSGGTTDHTGEINLKDAMMPMVSFARLYALYHRVNQTHTLERIETLADRGVIVRSSCDEIMAAYDFLMQLRLQTQAADLQAGRKPGNIIHPARLGYMQKELLKQAFSQIEAVQKKIRYDFLGGG